MSSTNWDVIRIVHMCRYFVILLTYEYAKIQISSKKIKSHLHEYSS